MVFSFWFLANDNFSIHRFSILRTQSDMLSPPPKTISENSKDPKQVPTRQAEKEVFSNLLMLVSIIEASFGPHIHAGFLEACIGDIGKGGLGLEFLRMFNKCYTRGFKSGEVVCSG